MRRLFLSISVIALGATALASTTQPVRAQGMLGMQPGYDWTGAYAGLGVSQGRADYRYTPAPEFWPNGSGAGFGGLIGYSWQQADRVYGVEAHFSAHRIRGSSATGMGLVETDMRTLASIRGRAGIARNRTLFFATAGPAITNVRHTAVDAGLRDSQTVAGVMIGLGVEHALLSGWHLRGELEHYNFGNGDFDTGNPGAFPDVRIRANVIRLSAVFRF
ncbi:outer membrane beta-barrel protein [Pararhodobacter sp. SW119]|uniref:outer membrane protein n=1 Tax=Pararhodobacter sp. SW119 TaxID=2780075 RepID=UPI001ADEDF66|nr:outer membrane beta-barrel protein [Pararhodobacter sp. SW119]